MTTFTDGYGGDVNTAIDTYVDSSNADTNYGTSTSIQLLLTSSVLYQIPLLKFTLTTLEGKAINDSTLYFYEKGWSSGAYTATVHRILVANTAWTEAGATWNHAVGTTDWAGGHSGCGVSATDFAAASMGTLSANGANGAGFEYAITLDATEFASMVAANYGLVLIMATGTGIQYLHSSNYEVTGYRPKLVVNLSEPAAGLITRKTLLGVGI